MNEFLIIYIVSGILAYLIGSLSPAILISKLNGKNIMKEGSGNAGATNAFRVLGPKWGSVVFLLDFAKGFITTFLAFSFLGYITGYIVGVAVIVGHIFSIFHKFKAGKGVAPSIGVVFAIDWKIALIVCGLGVLLLLISRRVSIGSICAAIALPIVTCFLCKPFIVCAIIICILIVFSHRSNIVRIFKGKEKAIF